MSSGSTLLILTLFWFSVVIFIILMPEGNIKSWVMGSKISILPYKNSQVLIWAWKHFICCDNSYFHIGPDEFRSQQSVKTHSAVYVNLISWSCCAVRTVLLKEQQGTIVLNRMWLWKTSSAWSNVVCSTLLSPLDYLWNMFWHKMTVALATHHLH